MKRISLLFFSALALSLLGGCSNAPKEYVGIVSAMNNEIALLLQEASIEKTETIAGVTYHAGTLKGKNVVICPSGIGKIRAASGVTTLLNRYHITKTIFTGIAGGVRDEESVLDEVVATRVCQHDYGRLDNEGFTWEGGDPGTGGEPGEYYACDPTLVSKAYDAAVAVLGKEHVWKGTIACGDQFVASEAYVDYLEKEHDAYACDMESAAIAVVCQSHGVPFAILRALSDKADGRARETYQDFGDVAAENSNRILLNMLDAF